MQIKILFSYCSKRDLEIALRKQKVQNYFNLRTPLCDYLFSALVSLLQRLRLCLDTRRLLPRKGLLLRVSTGTIGLVANCNTAVYVNRLSPRDTTGHKLYFNKSITITLQLYKGKEPKPPITLTRSTLSLLSNNRNTMLNPTCTKEPGGYPHTQARSARGQTDGNKRPLAPIKVGTLNLVYISSQKGAKALAIRKSLANLRVSDNSIIVTRHSLNTYKETPTPHSHTQCLLLSIACSNG